MAKNANAKTMRFHFSASSADTQIVNWINNQDNLSSSIRLVIKDYVSRHGMGDVSLQPIVVNPSGMDTAVQESLVSSENAAQPAAPVPEQPAVSAVSVQSPAPAPIPAASNSASSMLDDLMK